MILVRNHQQRLSGNKIVAITTCLVLSLTGCSVKRTTVLRSPGSDTKKQETTVSKPVDGNEKSAVKKGGIEEVNGFSVKNDKIALLLPFDLERIATKVTTEDVKRSSLALDFYQGFQLGLDQLAADGARFELRVIDSRDNVERSAALGTSAEVKDAVLVVGPVYPREIKSFGKTFANKNVLQVSPLAASMASEFSLPNLVSMTPSIRTHTEMMARYVAEQCYKGDQILIYDAGDEDSKQFLPNFSASVIAANKEAKVTTVHSIFELNRSLLAEGTNHIICGTANKNYVKNLLENLDAKFLESASQFKLYGHPNIAKLSFENYENIDFYDLTVSSSSLVDENNGQTKKFITRYKSTFQVDPSEFSYKGYDAAIYFGSLISKYGVDYVSHLTEGRFSGLNGELKFEFFPNWGYANRAVGFLVYRDGKFEKK